MGTERGPQVIDIVIHYRYEGEVHELRFGRGAEMRIPYSIYFNREEMEIAREAIGENSFTVLDGGAGLPEDGPDLQVMGPDDQEYKVAYMMASGGGMGTNALCWHDNMCDWWCTS